MMCALAFVKPEDVERVFLIFVDSIPDAFQPVATYFEVVFVILCRFEKCFYLYFMFIAQHNYIRGRRSRGRNAYTGPRFAIELWNQYQNVLDKLLRTNNSSEGWHTRYATLIGAKHPGFYTFLRGLQKEQARTDDMLRDLRMGHQVHKDRSLSRRQKEKRIYNIVSQYDDFVERGAELEYLEFISYYIHF